MSWKRKGLQFRSRFLQAGCRHPTDCENASSISAFSRNIWWWLVGDWLADDADVETCGVVRCWRVPVSRRSVGLAGETLRMSRYCRRLPLHAPCIAATPASQLNWVTLTQCRRLYQVSCCFFDSDHMHCPTVTLEYYSVVNSYRVTDHFSGKAASCGGKFLSVKIVCSFFSFVRL